MPTPPPIEQEIFRHEDDARAMDGEVERAMRILGVSQQQLPYVESASYEALRDYMSAAGIEYFSVDEVIKPRRESIARECGYTELIPPVHLWAFLVLGLKACDIVRDQLGSPVILGHAWRPRSYNAAVGGAKYSDHVDACGFDLWLRSQKDARQAEGIIRGMHAMAPELEISLGSGLSKLHLGVLSLKGSRNWTYGAMRKLPLWS